MPTPWKPRSPTYHLRIFAVSLVLVILVLMVFLFGVRLEAVADLAIRVNEGTENIGARRLYTIMEKLVEDISFAAPDLPGDGTQEVTIDAAYVQDRLRDIVRDQDVSRYIL